MAAVEGKKKERRKREFTRSNNIRFYSKLKKTRDIVKVAIGKYMPRRLRFIKAFETRVFNLKFDSKFFALSK